MNILEFHDFKLSDAVKFHNELNPALFDGTTMDPTVREQLLRIAKDFVEFLGLDDLDVKDITVSGSNAGYTYTPHSDIDLHIVVDLSEVCNDEVYKELFNAKKNLYNDKHDIKVRGYDVELYAQDSKQPHVSAGEYSVLRNRWNKLPVKRAADLKERAARAKFQKLVQLAATALKSGDRELVKRLLETIKKYRKAGLDEKGELGPENLAFKAFRSQGILQQLFDYLDELHSQHLSLAEASGYIPSEAEKNDPRFKTALTVDVHPNTMKKGAKAMGLGNISRAGIPQQANPSGKFKK
jgi:hypothetical protein